MPHGVASDQGLHCLLTGFSIKNRIKTKNRPDTPKMTNGLVQHITVEEFTSIQWVKSLKYYKSTTAKNLINSIKMNAYTYMGSNANIFPFFFSRSSPEIKHLLPMEQILSSMSRPHAKELY